MPGIEEGINMLKVMVSSKDTVRCFSTLCWKKLEVTEIKVNSTTRTNVYNNCFTYGGHEYCLLL